MERQADAHLNPLELEAILRSGGLRSVPEEAGVLQARKHVDSCTLCRSLVELHVAEESRLAKLRPRPPAARTPVCPPEIGWPTLAAGLTDDSEAETLLGHAAECDYCGPLLRKSLADFTEELTPAEDEFLASLESARPEWQNRMAARLAGEARQSGIFRWFRQALFGLPVPTWAYAAPAVLVALVFSIGPLRIWPRPVEDLLAAAYTNQRTLEMRIPQAAYSPLRVMKGSPGLSHLDRPTALRESEARIARKLTETPNDPRWLQARARAELLDHDFDSAIADLQQCLTLRQGLPHLMTDLGSAYFERAEAKSVEGDYDTAINFLNRALKATPNDPVALFNRAIIYQRLRLYGPAIEDWEHYLGVDPNSKWAAEAQQRLADIEQGTKKIN